MRIELFHLRFPRGYRLLLRQFAAKLIRVGSWLTFETDLPPSPQKLSMSNTLTLGSTDYLLTDGTSFNSSSGLAPGSATLASTNAATITGTGVTHVAVDLGASADTLVINTTLTGSSNIAANSVVQLGGGNDIVTINSAVSDYRIDGGGANDTLVINANLSGTVITGSAGADSIVFSSGTITGSQLSVGTTTFAGDNAADTLTILAGAKGVNTFITNFNAAQDTLIIGGTTITGLGDLAAGSYSGAQYAATAGSIQALTDWLNDGGNKITLI
jgi:Ca2+-binding RTX toxin-like protein